LLLSLAAGSLLAADEPAEPDAPADVKQDADKDKDAADKGFQLTEKWTVLVAPNRRAPGQKPLPKKVPLENCAELRFTGPNPGHPFVIGDYIEDGKFAFVDGALMLVEGKNAAVAMPTADQFELEGVMEQVEFGGWFMLVGWDEGRGYLISNATMKESGSPWFVTEMRGGTAIPEATQQLLKYEWKKSQPFRVSVVNKQFTLEVDQVKVINALPIDNYAPGRVILGVYDTRYGPKKLRIHSLRMRAVVPEAEAEKAQ